MPVSKTRKKHKKEVEIDYFKPQANLPKDISLRRAVAYWASKNNGVLTITDAIALALIAEPQFKVLRKSVVAWKLNQWRDLVLLRIITFYVYMWGLISDKCVEPFIVKLDDDTLAVKPASEHSYQWPNELRQILDSAFEKRKQALDEFGYESKEIADEKALQIFRNQHYPRRKPWEGFNPDSYPAYKAVSSKYKEEVEFCRRQVDTHVANAKDYAFPEERRMRYCIAYLAKNNNWTLTINDTLFMALTAEASYKEKFSTSLLRGDYAYLLPNNSLAENFLNFVMTFGHPNDPKGKPKFSTVGLESFKCEPIPVEEFAKYLTVEERKCLDKAFETRETTPWTDGDFYWLKVKKAELRARDRGMVQPKRK